MQRLRYSPLERGVGADRLLVAAARLHELVWDESKPVWLRRLAAMKATEARAFARVELLRVR